MSTYETPFDARLVPAATLEAERQAALPTAAIEQYRALARRLDVLKHRGGAKALVVTSARAGEGRTSTALYTSVALAGRGHRVLLADFDLRRPELAVRHDLPRSPGIVEVVQGHATLDEALHLVRGAPGLTLLPSGEAQEDPAVVLHDPRLRQLLDSLRGSFDFLVCDAPPTLGVADAACLGDLVGAALLVTRAGATSRRELAMAAASLYGVPILGAVIIGVEGFASIEARRTAEVVARKPTSVALARR
jgi:receptor protein-tyrosine kinase